MFSVYAAAFAIWNLTATKGSVNIPPKYNNMVARSRGLFAVWNGMFCNREKKTINNAVQRETMQYKQGEND